MTVLSAADIRVVRDATPVLDGVSLTVRPGEVVGLLGPNGSGKSTLLKVMAGLIRQTSGTVDLDGMALVDHARQERARRIGYLPQDAVSDWPLTVRRVVSLGRVPHRSPLRGLSATDADAVIQALTLTDTTHLADRVVTTLSGGERTRVMISRVLAGRPDLLLLDEPVTGLDPRHQLDLMELLQHLAKGPERKGCLVVLHDLAIAAGYCDRVHVLSRGRTLAGGPKADVLIPATIREAFAVDVEMVDTANGPVPLLSHPSDPRR